MGPGNSIVCSTRQVQLVAQSFRPDNMAYVEVICV
jgi:hypothetical protein